MMKFGNRIAMRTIFLALLLSGLTILAYRPVWNGGFIWDDDRYVTNNPLLAAPDGLRRIWFSLDAPSQYFPLTYTVLRVERFLWGLNPAGYHWVNLLFHVANALLVWRMLTRLNLPGGWPASAIFALHPVQVESVAWISELKNLLMGFFFLLTLLAWIEFIDSRGDRRRIFYVAALIFYFLALAAKSTACTLPAAMLLILWWQHRPIGRKALAQVAPFLGLAVAVGIIAIWWEKYHQGTRVLVSIAPLDRLLIASRAIWFYLSKIFWPSDLTFIYPQWEISPSDPAAYTWLLLTVVLAVFIWLARRRFGRGPEVAALFFVLTLGPLLGFVMLYTFRYTFVADHYQYLACIGPIAFACCAFVRYSERIRNGRWIEWTATLAALICLTFLTVRQSETYRDIETLWRTTIARDPNSWMAYNNLGVVRFEKGQADEAIADYRRSLRLHPDYPEAHYNLGSALLHQGQVDDAIQECESALALLPNEPDAHVVLGNAFLVKNEVDQAIGEYAKALTIRPDDSNAHYNLGVAFQQKGETGRAADEFEKAKELDRGHEP